MDYSIGAVIGSGLVATLVMTAMLYMGIAMMPKQMTMNLLYMLGSMVTTAKPAVYVVGAMIHTMMGLGFAFAHVGLFQAFDLEGDLLGWGILFGVFHWMIVGMGMGMMKPMHPQIKSGALAAPGFFVVNYPAMTVMGFVMLHLLYGLLVGVLYEAWV